MRDVLYVTIAAAMFMIVPDALSSYRFATCVEACEASDTRCIELCAHVALGQDPPTLCAEIKR